MSFNTDLLRTRLASSTEVADSITSTAHWILFHKRHASSIAEQWAEAITSDENKLPEIYIANEVIQQSKIKRKTEFVEAFGKVLPCALPKAYAQSDLPTRDRIMRVVRVWRDRNVFDSQTQLNIEQALKSAGESIASSVPADLVTLVQHYSSWLAAEKSSNGDIQEKAAIVLSDLDDLKVKVEKLASEKANIFSPEIEPLPSASNEEPETELYTAQTAQNSLASNAANYQNNDEIGYTSESDECAEGEAPPAVKKQKVDVDPKLASFLASLSGS